MREVHGKRAIKQERRNQTTPLEAANNEKLEYESIEKGEWVEPQPVKIAEVCGKITGIGLLVVFGILLFSYVLALVT